MSILLQSLSKFYAEHLVVNKVTLEINDGELFVLLGGSGSGKSTILRLIAGLSQPDEGRIELNGRDVTRVPTQKRGVGVVFQHYALFNHMSVLENVEFGLRIRQVLKKKRQQRAEELLDLVGLGGLGDRYPSQLSGGQRQRVAVARALAYDPSVLLLDEPFGALDVLVRTQVRESFKELQRRLKMTTILVTHDQEEAFELGDRIGVLERGKLLEIGDPESLYHKPRTEGVATFLGGGNVLVGRVREKKIMLGQLEMPLQANAPHHEEGSPVRVLFRPEAVHVESLHNQPLGEVVPLGQGVLTSTSFAGSQVRLRFELPSLEGARQLAPAPRYGQKTPVIEVKSALTNGKVEIGKSYQLGLHSYHVLTPTGIKLLALIEPASIGEGVIKLGSALASAGRGAMTILSACEERERPEFWRALEDLSRIAHEGSSARIDVKLRIGEYRHEIAAEAQEGFYEVVLLQRQLFNDQDGVRKLTHQLVGEVHVPVMLIGESHRRISRILICTAGGAPGRGDVRIGGRIARQTGAFVSLFHVTSGTETDYHQKLHKQHLEDAQRLLYSIGIKSDVKAGSGAVIESVLTTAREGDFDLIVVGSSRDSVGRISEEIVRGAQCPVLVVPSASEGL